ncbi:MAG TPA: DNA polymerase III subunit gamma/tau, partial [Mizugakiibacter sp.]|nr:DNA polymerase III subunit gamma/tau [Mizugakiibacter sp.]
MSYQVLARKWRPRRFAELVGQEHVVRALMHSLDSGRMHHAYLFTGTRGVGKTTIARIFAKSLNCAKGVSAEPCGECSVCRSVDEGRFIDLLEIDAASNTGVDDVRELIENAQYAPTSGRYKVYLIDEVHMLSRSAFNALLKILEEPPEHAKFLLATTDPQKLPVTVLSRCLQFSLKRLLPEQIVAQMRFILQAEHIEFDDEALTELTRGADGSLRDGLSLLDQAIAYGG